MTYNAQFHIEKCLKSVLKNTYVNFFCIVVDNASTDKTADIIKNKFPQVELIKQSKNLGYAVGNNIGIKHARKFKKPDYILLLNPDTIVHKNLLIELVQAMEKDQKIGVCGPIITYANNIHKIWFAGGIVNKWFWYTKHQYLNKTIPPGKITSKKTDYITGACMMIRVRIFRKTGLLPIHYYMYYEDVDFCLSVQKYGYSCYLLAKHLVRHIVSSSAGISGTNDFTPFQAYYYARNPFIYIKKKVKGIYKITNYLGQFFIRLPYYGWQILKKRNIKSLLSYFEGLVAGMQY